MSFKSGFLRAGRSPTSPNAVVAMTGCLNFDPVRAEADARRWMLARDLAYLQPDGSLDLIIQGLPAA